MTSFKSEAHSQQGFTLIELSIVLVIIGLIVGGVLTGRSLIKQASLRAALSQVDKLTASVNTFRDKFGGLPGDLSNFAAVGMATPSVATWVGDGAINDGAGTGLTFDGEAGDFFVDLQTAQILQDMYSPQGPMAAGPAGGGSLGTTLAASPFGQGFYIWAATGKGTAAAGIAGSSVGQYNWVHLAKVTAVNNGTGAFTAALGMTPTDAAGIDSKIDDGNPATGNVLGTDVLTGDIGLTPGAGACSSAAGVYDVALDPTKPECNVAIKATF